MTEMVSVKSVPESSTSLSKRLNSSLDGWWTVVRQTRLLSTTRRTAVMVSKAAVRDRHDVGSAPVNQCEHEQ